MTANQPQPPKRHSAVVEAVREKYEKLKYTLKDLEATAEKAHIALAQANRAVAEQNRELEELWAFLQSQAESTGEFELKATEQHHKPAFGSGARKANQQIVYRVKHLLGNGQSWKTADIYDELLKQGVVFTAANPTQRISQLLSESEWFESDRLKGWTLKGEDPAATGSSSATKSDEDEF